MHLLCIYALYLHYDLHYNFDLKDTFNTHPDVNVFSAGTRDVFGGSICYLHMQVEFGPKRPVVFRVV